MYYLNEKIKETEYQYAQQAIRDTNLKRVFNLIHSGRAKTRVELAHAAGLSPAAVTSLTEDLIENHLAIETGLGWAHAGGGRRPVLLEADSRGAQIPVFSIDTLGVTYTLYDLCLKPIERVFRPYLCQPNDPDSGAQYVSIMRDVIENRSGRLNRSIVPAVLLTIPGMRVKAEQTLHITGMNTTIPIPLLDELEKDLQLPVFFGNDSMALAYAEMKRMESKGEDVDDLIYFNICSGVGAGILREGMPVGALDGFSGEVGHITIQMNGRPCPCGNKGCLERYVSIPAIQNEVRNEISDNPGDMFGKEMRALLSDTTLERIGDAATKNMDPVMRALENVAECLAAGIYSVVNITGIHRVVLGGINALGETFLDRIQTLLTDGGKRFLMKDVMLRYGGEQDGMDSLGIAQYFIDHVFMT